MQTTPVRELVDNQGRRLGKAAIERRDGDLLFAAFAAGPDFRAVKALFQEFEEAAESQALSELDEIDTRIRSLGLYFAASDNTPAVQLDDVQIWGDGRMTCRAKADGDRNGMPPRR